MRVLHHGRPGIRVGWLRGRACSTTRSWDGLAAPAPTATGGKPLPKPVSRKKVWQESGWYVTGHVRGVQALFSRRSRFASFSRGTRVGSTESLTTSAVMIT